MLENTDRNDRIKGIVLERQRLGVRLRKWEFAQMIKLGQVNTVAGEAIVQRESNEVRTVCAADFKDGCRRGKAQCRDDSAIAALLERAREARRLVFLVQQNVARSDLFGELPTERIGRRCGSGMARFDRAA